MFKPSIVDKLDEDLADVLAKASFAPAESQTITINAIPYAPPLVRAPSTTAETIRLAYETVAKRHEEAAENCRETADRQIENHLSLAKIIREQGEQSALAAGKACEVAAKYGDALDTLRKGLTEGAADSN